MYNTLSAMNRDARYGISLHWMTTYLLLKGNVIVFFSLRNCNKYFSLHLLSAVYILCIPLNGFYVWTETATGPSWDSPGFLWTAVESSREKKREKSKEKPRVSNTLQPLLHVDLTCKTYHTLLSIVSPCKEQRAAPWHAWSKQLLQ